MRLLFVSYQDFGGNSSMHIYHLANALSSRGVDVLTAVHRDPASVAIMGSPPFKTISYKDLLALPEDGRFSAEETLVHAWTPREGVRKLVLPFCAKHRLPYAVHLEDHEDHLTAQALRLPMGVLAEWTEAEFENAAKDTLSHPRFGKAFLQGSAGVTAVIDRLLEFGPSDRPGMAFWPGFDPALEPPPDEHDALRRRYGIKNGELAIAYTGNTHPANVNEVSSLYLAVGVLNRHGTPTRLLRTGIDHVPLDCMKIPAIASNVTSLGFVDRKTLAGVLAAADFFVQPGRSGTFNDFRFPSKIPSFLSAGKPVLLPATNIGRFLSDGVNAVLLKDGNATEIAERIEDLAKDPGRCARIGAGGKEFADTHLGWEQSADKLLAFYQEVLAAPAIPASRPPGPAASGATPAAASQGTGGSGAQRTAPTLELISCHLPKTAGTAFCNVLEQAYGPGAVLVDNTYNPHPDVQVRQGIRAIHGHFHGASYSNRYPKAIRVTWVRNPAARLVSHFFFWKNLPLQQDSNEHRRLLEESLGFLEFAQLAGIRNHLSQTYLKDLQPSDFDFIGVQEYFEEDVQVLARRMGWPLPNVQRVNESAASEYLDLVASVLSDRALMAQLRDWNQEDFSWYNAALKTRSRSPARLWR